jgi:hypothetical protein
VIIGVGVVGSGCGVRGVGAFVAMLTIWAEPLYPILQPNGCTAG